MSAHGRTGEALAEYRAARLARKKKGLIGKKSKATRASKRAGKQKKA